MENSSYRHGFARLLGSVIVVHFVSAVSAAEVTYADIAPVLKQRCVVCHSGPAAPRGLRLDSLQGLMAGSDNGAVAIDANPAGSELIRRLKGDTLPRMPMTGPPYLAAAETSLFENWIAAGMPAGEKAVPTAAGPVLADAADARAFVTFDQVAPIFARRCARCHTDNGLMGGPPEGYRLTSYQSVVSAEDRARIVPGNTAASELMRRILGQARPQMPYDGPPFLAAEEIALIGQWIDDGARNSAGEVLAMPVGARVRLHGTLRDDWQLDDLHLTVGSGTRVRGRPQSGDRVRVRAYVKADGSIRVDRIRVR